MILHKKNRPNKEITVVNIYIPNIGVKLTNVKGEIDSNTIIVEDFNTPLSPMDRSSKQRINKETQTLNEILDRSDQISRSVMSNSLQPHESQHARPPCP